MTRLRLALEWFLNPDHVPFLVARHHGWFAEAGLELTLVEPAEHFDAFGALQRGEIELAITEPIHLLQDRAKGEDLVGFGRFLHTRGGVMVLGASGITRPAQLAGCRLQYPGAPGPGGPAIVRTMIAADGGPADAPITPVNNGFFHTDALATGKADAATLVFSNFEGVEAAHRGLSPRVFTLADWGVPDFCQLHFITRPAVLAAHGPALRRFFAVVRRAVDFALASPDEARRIYDAETGGSLGDALSAAIFAETVPAFRAEMDLPAAYWQSLADWLLATGQIDAPLPIAGAWVPAADLS